MARRLTQPVRLSMQDMAVIKAALIRDRDGIEEAVKPFGLVSTWDASTRVREALDKITEARCDLKRRQSPDYNPAGDSECADYATDAEWDAWYEAHPEALAATPSPDPTEQVEAVLDHMEPVVRAALASEAEGQRETDPLAPAARETVASADCEDCGAFQGEYHGTTCPRRAP